MTVSRSDPSRLKIRWDAVPSGRERAAEQAQQAADAANRARAAGDGAAAAGGAEAGATRGDGLDARAYIYNSIMRPSDYLVAGFDDLMPQDLARKLTGEELDSVVVYVLSLN